MRAVADYDELDHGVFVPDLLTNDSDDDDLPSMHSDSSVNSAELLFMDKDDAFQSSITDDGIAADAKGVAFIQPSIAGAGIAGCAQDDAISQPCTIFSCICNSDDVNDNALAIQPQFALERGFVILAASAKSKQSPSSLWYVCLYGERIFTK